MNLTADQRRAIDLFDRNLQLVACAGSGKTEVVARHVAALLSEADPPVAPANVVAFTFAEKAAGELKSRIVERCRERTPDITGLAEMFVGTIHAFCLDLLKSEVSEYLKFEVLNEVQQQLFVDRFSVKSGFTTSRALDGRPLKRGVDTGRYIEALSIL
jgi:DNA helicase-2/ATP-dependent DNA helicase PcrA